MAILLIGLVMFVGSAFALWRMLPRNGKPHRLVATFMETYVAIAICAGLALGVALILSGIGTQLS